MRPSGRGRILSLRERFGAHVRQLRRARALTQEALAERSTLSVDAIRRIEGGRLSPTLQTLEKLGLGLQVSLETLFAALGNEQPAPQRELLDYVATLDHRQAELAFRVLRAMFSG